MNLRPPNLKNKFAYSCRPSYRWQPRGVQALLAPAQGYGAVAQYQLPSVHEVPMSSHRQDILF